MKKILTFSALASLLALQGCMGPKPGSPEAKALVVKEMQEQKAEVVENTVSDIPNWCIELPKTNVAIYSCGIGNSSQLNLARNRALLDAKRQLADVVIDLALRVDPRLPVEALAHVAVAYFELRRVPHRLRAQAGGRSSGGCALRRSPRPATRICSACGARSPPLSRSPPPARIIRPPRERAPTLPARATTRSYSTPSLGRRPSRPT